MKLRIKLTAFFFFIPLLILIIAGALLVSKQTGVVLQSKQNALKLEILLQAKGINAFLEEAESDLVFLSQFSSLQETINSPNSQFSAQQKSILEADFLVFAQNKPKYYQIRYIDEKGMEIVRVDRKEAEPFIVSKDKLQNKNGRYYFEDAMSAKEGVVFVSPLDLNIENGELENRGSQEEPDYVPVIRYATPVFSSRGEAKGIIITNIYADGITQNLKNSSQDSLLTLINSDGYYLSHPDSSKEWGFMLDTQERLRRDYGREIFSNIENREHQEGLEIHSSNIDESIFYTTVKEYKNHFVADLHIYPSGQENLSSSGSNKAYASSIEKTQGEEYYWTLVGIADKNALIREALESIFFETGLLILSVIALVFILILASLAAVFVCRIPDLKLNNQKKGPAP